MSCLPTTAVVDGRTLPRVQHDYSDHRLYTLKHRGAYPEIHAVSDGLETFDGELEGNICGFGVNFEARFRKSGERLEGFVTPVPDFSVTRRVRTNPRKLALRAPVEIEVREVGGERRLTGRLVDGDFAARVPDFDLVFNDRHFQGSIGRRVFDLRRNSDATMRGVMSVDGVDFDFTLDGVDEMGRMPAADQALLVPFLLGCPSLQAKSGPQLTVSLRPAL
jgi:hypothetical protein